MATKQQSWLLDARRLQRLDTQSRLWFEVCEKITLRALLFVCFMLEIARFVGWLFR